MEKTFKNNTEKVVAVKDYWDEHKRKLIKENTAFDVSEERAKKLIKLGLVKKDYKGSSYSFDENKGDLYDSSKKI